MSANRIGPDDAEEYVSEVQKHMPPDQSGTHVLILGAGPAGLTAAYECVVRHAMQATLVEMDPTYVGGISRTVEYRGYRFDIGGHRFFSKNQEIEDPRCLQILKKGVER